MRRIGVLTPFPADDAEGHARLTAFTQALQQSGWRVGQNVRIDYRWGPGNPATMRKHATELIALEPDVVLALTTAAVGPLLEASRTVPIVFVTVADPVAAGYVETLARPGGNATGFTPYEYSISGKWLELLKEIAPRVTRAAVLRDTSIGVGSRPVRRDPGACAVTGRGAAPRRRARCQRDRASAAKPPQQSCRGRSIVCTIVRCRQ